MVLGSTQSSRRTSSIYNNVIMRVYIAPEPGNPVLRRCTVLLSPTRTCFHPAHISTPNGPYNPCCHHRRKAFLKLIAIASRQVLNFYGWVNQSPSDGIAVCGDWNPRPFGYEFYALTNCAITARPFEEGNNLSDIVSPKSPEGNIGVESCMQDVHNNGDCR